ncbi:transposase family protein [Streptomyces sp. NPDC014864]|uniref:transposase family protein n=1 Tax=Streptomyces sp. NPDC014864 TaxID=3364924 RepID=UPI0036F5D910
MTTCWTSCFRTWRRCWWSKCAWKTAWCGSKPAPAAVLPDCGVSSVRVHSWYRRCLADAAVGGRPVAIDLSVRRLFCDVASCARRNLR